MAPTDNLTYLWRRQQISGVLPPPPGVDTNFEHPVSHGHYLSLSSVVCIVIAAIFVFARLWVKLVISRAPGWEDGKPSIPVSFRSHADSDIVTSVLALVRCKLITLSQMLIATLPRPSLLHSPFSTFYVSGYDAAAKPPSFNEKKLSIAGVLAIICGMCQ